MSFIGAGCKIMEDGVLNELWSTVYQENFLPKMIEVKAYSRCLRAELQTDSALPFSLLSTKETQNTECDKRVLEPASFRVFHKSDDVQDENIFKTFYDIEDAKSIADKLTDTLRNNFSDDPLFISKEDTIKQLIELYESLSSNQCNPDAAVNTNIVSMIHEKLSNLKFIHNTNRTGKLWIPYMDFDFIVRMSIRAERPGDWNLHIHASEQIPPFLGAAGHNNYLKGTLKQF